MRGAEQALIIFKSNILSASEKVWTVRVSILPGYIVTRNYLWETLWGRKNVQNQMYD